MIFAREISDNLTSLVKKLDEAAIKNKSARMGGFVVFCSDDEGLEKKLKELAKKETLKEMVLTIDNPNGPGAYKLAKEADVTVVLYVRHKVMANHAFKKGALKSKDVDAIVADVSKILPTPKKKSE